MTLESESPDTDHGQSLPEETSLIPLILGTAGHIDHGKSALIRVLTGAETDRLPEEKRRGITIQLGFAQLDIPPFRLGVVDVPGHEKFVRTMLSGATGIDLALLVVAADDSINQQTREHLEILNYLQVPAGVIAITKSDRVDEAWLELVEEEIRHTVQDTVLEDAQIIRTSAVEKTGLAPLINALKAAAQRAYAQRKDREDLPFRMAVDRVFSSQGQGTVVTGSVTAGRIRVGQSVQRMPAAGEPIRVRQIQTHDSSVASVGRGQRAALNLAGLRTDQIERGDWLVEPESVLPSQCLTARIQLSPAAQLQDHQVVRLHLGTADVMGQVRWIPEAEDGDQESGRWAQILLRQPVVVGWRQPVVLRRVSPVQTLGVAIVHSASLPRQHRWSDIDRQMLEALASADRNQQVQAVVYFDRTGQSSILDLAHSLAMTSGEVESLLAKTPWVEVQTGTSQWRFHPDRIQEFSEQLIRKLERMHDQEPHRWVFSIAAVMASVPWLAKPVLDHIIQKLSDQNRLRVNARGVGLSRRGPQLTRNQQLRLDWILEKFSQAGLAPPTVKQCVEAAEKNKQDVPQLIRMAIDSGDLVEVHQDLILSQETLQQAWDVIRQGLSDGQGKSVADIRDLLQISRKMTVPLCEYWDRQGQLQRQGDLRFLTMTESSTD